MLMFGPPGVFLFYYFTKMNAQTSQTETSQLGVENSTESQLAVVKFHNSKISCTIDPNGQIWVGINPICEAVGILSNHAIVGIKKDPILGSIIRERVLLDAKKRKFPMQCLPIEYVHGWLFSIDASKVSAAAKPKLLQFKKECYQVLFDHFYGKYKVYEHNLNQRRRLIAELATEQANRALISTRISQIKKQLAEIEEMEMSGQLTLNIGGK
jgi:hypothetical protein